MATRKTPTVMTDSDSEGETSMTQVTSTDTGDSASMGGVTVTVTKPVKDRHLDAVQAARENADGSFSIAFDDDEPAPQAEGGSVDGDGADDDEDSRLAQSQDDENDPDLRAKRERRRAERQQKKQAQREREDRLRQEVASRDQIIGDLTNRVAMIERRAQGGEVATIDAHLQECDEAERYFKTAIEQGVKESNGEIVAEATNRLQQVSIRRGQLLNIKQGFVSRLNQPAPMDPVVANFAKTFIEKNKWYNPRGGDWKSQVVLSTDQELHREGIPPTTEKYWRELAKRIKARIPNQEVEGFEVTNDDDDGDESTPPTPPKKSGKPPITGGDRTATSGAGSRDWTLSKGRVDAIKQAGKWDDPKARAQMIKYFRDFDKQKAAERR